MLKGYLVPVEASEFKLKGKEKSYDTLTEKLKQNNFLTPDGEPVKGTGGIGVSGRLPLPTIFEKDISKLLDKDILNKLFFSELKRFEDLKNQSNFGPKPAHFEQQPTQATKSNLGPQGQQPQYQSEWKPSNTNPAPSAQNMNFAGQGDKPGQAKF